MKNLKEFLSRTFDPEFPVQNEQVIMTMVEVANMIVPREFNVNLGEIVFELIEQGEIDWATETQIERIKAAHDRKEQGGISNWDSIVFLEYYEVDVICAIRKWVTFNLIEREL